MIQRLSSCWLSVQLRLTLETKETETFDVPDVDSTVNYVFTSNKADAAIPSRLKFLILIFCCLFRGGSEMLLWLYLISLCYSVTYTTLFPRHYYVVYLNDIRRVHYRARRASCF